MSDDLISRSALMEIMRQHDYPLATRQGSVDNGMFTTGIQQAVDECPAVDAVPVVRCGDCKHCLFDLSVREAHLCMRMENGFPVRRRRKADDFCSYGERKDA